MTSRSILAKRSSTWFSEEWRAGADHVHNLAAPPSSLGFLQARGGHPYLGLKRDRRVRAMGANHAAPKTTRDWSFFDETLY